MNEYVVYGNLEGQERPPRGLLVFRTVYSGWRDIQVMPSYDGAKWKQRAEPEEREESLAVDPCWEIGLQGARGYRMGSFLLLDTSWRPLALAGEFKILSPTRPSPFPVSLT